MSDFVLGIVGVAVSAFGQFILDHLRYRRETKAQRDIDNKRKQLLTAALENPPGDSDWRKLETLAGLIGADHATTTRLLIELGARGSEGGNDVWALLSRKPLGGSRKV